MRHTCRDCHLSYRIEMLNLVSGDPEDALGNYCPNCGGGNVDRGVIDR